MFWNWLYVAFKVIVLHPNMHREVPLSSVKGFASTAKKADEEGTMWHFFQAAFELYCCPEMESSFTQEDIYN